MDLTQELGELAERHSHELGALPWPSEADRWAELVFCLINAFMGDDATQARKALEGLSKAGVLLPEHLSRARELGSPEGTVVRYVLGVYGVSEADLERVADALGRVATATQMRYAGKLQKYLRDKGREMRDELVATFSLREDEQDDVRRAVTHWLQNSLSLPVAVEDAWVMAFLTGFDSSLQDLEDAADAADINLALVDELIRLDKRSQSGSS